MICDGEPTCLVGSLVFPTKCTLFRRIARTESTNALQLVTGWIQSFYYRVTTPAGGRFPQPGEARWIRHRKITFILVVVTYLLYTIYEADWTLQRQSDFYKDLGVPVDADEKRLQSRFRRLSVDIISFLPIIG
jgi:hypothetical protein